MFEAESMSDLPSQRPSPKIEIKDRDESGEKASEATQPAETTSPILVHEDIIKQKKRWGQGISIYRLVNGKFQTKDHDEELKKEK